MKIPLFRWHFYRNKFFSSIENINIIILMCPSRLKLEIQDIRRFDFILIVLQKNIFYFLLFYFLLLFLKYFIFKMKNILSYSIFFLGGTIQFISKNHFLSCNQIILIFLSATFYWIQSHFFHLSKSIHLILIPFLSKSL